MKRYSRSIQRNMIPAVRLAIVLVVCTFLLMGSSLLAHPAQVHIKILVVVCEYADTETPEIKSRQWADELNLGINTLYTTATHQQAPEFEFIPVLGVLRLDVDYSTGLSGGGDGIDLVEDPGVIDREGVAALNYARQRVPEYFSEPVYLLAVVNRSKARRARALFDFPLVSELQGEIKVKASIAVLADPLANLRPDLSSSEIGSEVADTDGDGLSDDQETMLGTLSDRADSDGDGYSDWAEFSLGISDPLNSISKLSLPDQAMSAVAHLVGHQIGLPGLHQDGRYVTEDSFGYWGLMARDNSQGLSGFTRFHSKWYDTRFGELIIDVEPGGWEEPLFYLVESSFQFIGSFLPPGVFEIVRIRRPSLPDVLLEARPKFSVDASRFAEGFSRLGDFSGLPDDYQPGVLVSLIDPGYNGQIFPQPGQYGVPIAQVLPHFDEGEPAPGNEGTASKFLGATIGEQQVFRDAYGLKVTVGRFDRFEGSYEVAIKSDPLPSFPDLAILGSWLDSSVNGYGNFTFGRDDVSGEPRLGGDPVHLLKCPEFRWVDASLVVGMRSGSREHRVTFQLENVGMSDAPNVAGTIYVLPGLILPLADSMFDSEVLSSLALAQEDVFVEKLIPGESSEVSMVFRPEGPVQAVLLVEASPHEYVIHNNRHRSVFWTEYAALDTFHPSIKRTVHFYNGSAFDHHLAAQVSDVPVGWEERFSVADAEALRWSTLLNSGALSDFQLDLTPPPPDEGMPGTVQQITIDTWVDYSDSDVPAGDLPLAVVLSFPTILSIELQEDQDGIMIIGQLTNGAEEGSGLSDGVIVVEVAGSDGSHQSLLATTSPDGQFVVRVDATPRTRYAAVANFIGNDFFAPVSSDLIQWGEDGNLPSDQIRITSIQVTGERMIRLNVSNTLPHSISIHLLKSNDLSTWQKAERKKIPSGDSEWHFPYEPNHDAAFFKLVNGEW